MSLLVTMKGIPLAYNKDMQEDKVAAFDAMDTAKNCLTLFTDMLSTLKFNRSAMEKSAVRGFTNATDAADYLVNKGMPFRDAHSVIGRLVLHCIDRSCAIDDLDISELKEFSELFEDDIYDAISLKTCVEKRLTEGAPGRASMEKAIAASREYLGTRQSAESVYSAGHI
jgi:argininosuccinate lyase